MTFRNLVGRVLEVRGAKLVADADGLRRLTEFGATCDINVIVENHGGLSSNGAWLSEVIRTVERVLARKVPVIQGPRRPGDPAQLVADAKRARAELRWTPRYSDLDTIIRHAARWEARRVAPMAGASCARVALRNTAG